MSLIERLKKWWNRPRPFRAWAVRKNGSYERDTNWCKVVSNSRGRPAPLDFSVVGPFRSEIECDEFCDHMNVGFTGKALLYQALASQPAKEPAP